MKLHVLSGDSLTSPFRDTGIDGEVAVLRECLVDGPVSADSLDEFFREREDYLSGGNPEDRDFYRENVRPQIEKIFGMPDHCEIDLWFEHELFCQANMWFLLNGLRGRSEVFAVLPAIIEQDRRFDGWASLESEDLKACYENKIRVTAGEMGLAAKLWQAFASRDRGILQELSFAQSDVFVYLKEVAAAAAEIDDRPANVIHEIHESGVSSFGNAFREFRKREPVYGFGDVQVKRIWEAVRGG